MYMGGSQVQEIISQNIFNFTNDSFPNQYDDTNDDNDGDDNDLDDNNDDVQMMSLS